MTTIKVNNKKVAISTVKSYMRNNKHLHIDSLTGELNSTSLAEDAANHFDLYEEMVNYTIPKILFEIARTMC
jgi:hypothetical protein